MSNDVVKKKLQHPRLFGGGRRYFVKTPWWLKKIYSSYIWSIDTREKRLYLSFDDGPHPQATPFVLEHLKEYKAKATFFCIGKNVVDHPEIYKQIIDEGHSVGNHTQNHLNGWKTRNDIYVNDVQAAQEHIKSQLFRPPYGRMNTAQRKGVMNRLGDGGKIIMWSVLSGDFDKSISLDRCLQNVISNSYAGAIVVFHDSEKALNNLIYALPRVLEYYSERGYSFDAIK